MGKSVSEEDIRVGDRRRSKKNNFLGRLEKRIKYLYAKEGQGIYPCKGRKRRK